MARTQTSALAAPTAVAKGAATDTSNINTIVVAVTGTFTATYAVEASLDSAASDASFVSAGTLSAPGRVAVTGPALWVRLNCTAYTSGSPAALVGGVH